MNFRYHLTTLVFAGASLVCSVSFAETIEGVLSRGPIYSALFTSSSESGDLIGYAFRNQSAVGVHILSRCLPEMFCKVAHGTTRLLTDTSDFEFKDEPQGWLEITTAHGADMETVVFGYKKSESTRFGKVVIREQDNRLMFRGAAVTPALLGAYPSTIVAKYEIGTTDVLLVQETGGTSCPAQFRLIIVAREGIRSTDAFGSCSDVIYPKSDGARVIVSMPGFAGPFQPDREKEQARRTRLDYVFAGGVVRLSRNTSN